jgi:hypothetical protein
MRLPASAVLLVLVLALSVLGAKAGTGVGSEERFYDADTVAPPEARAAGYPARGKHVARRGFLAQKDVTSPDAMDEGLYGAIRYDADGSPVASPVA